jgi:hypothetical protein
MELNRMLQTTWKSFKLIQVSTVKGRDITFMHWEVLTLLNIKKEFTILELNYLINFYLISKV